MHKKLENLFHNANAEFWLQLNEDISEKFGIMLRDYLDEQYMAGVKFILEDYKRWKEANPEAK